MSQAPISTAAIIVFARLPVPGRVKTRLAVHVGRENACTLYNALASHTILIAVRLLTYRKYSSVRRSRRSPAARWSQTKPSCVQISIACVLLLFQSR